MNMDAAPIIYPFYDTVKVNIYDDLLINFSEIAACSGLKVEEVEQLAKLQTV